MSEPIPERRPGSERRVLGLPRNVVIYGGAALVAALGFLWWRSRKTATPAAASTTTTGASNGTDYGAQLGELQAEIQQLQQAGTGAGAGGGSGGSSGSSGSGSGGTPVTMSLPNGSLGWEQVTFPSQAAVDAWGQWNQNFAASHGGRTQAYRSEWNTELKSLGVPANQLMGPSTTSPNPYDRG